MALKPFAFGLRLRDKGRTVRVVQDARDPGKFRVEDSRTRGRSRQREHGSLGGALRDAAAKSIDARYVEYPCDHNDFPGEDNHRNYWRAIEAYLSAHGILERQVASVSQP